ncbi:MAG: prepilin peptidase [Desulfatirhabdiaceae bacterium]
MHSFVTNQTIAFLCIALIVAAIYDLGFYKIPNMLNFTLIAFSVSYYGWTHGLDGLLFSISGMFLGVALLIGPYLLGGMGAGDAKLMGAVGAVLGPKGVFISFLYTAIVGGIYAGIMLMMYRSHAKNISGTIITGIKSFLLTRQWVTDSSENYEKSPKLCYGLAIALGTISYLALEWMGYNFFSEFRW